MRTPLAFAFDEGSPATEAGYPGAAPLATLRFPAGHVVARSSKMRDVHRLLGEVAVLDDPVLITGETGVGKEHVARILHRSSRRRAGPFVPVNCAAIPKELMEAEMFGVGENVATGVARRPGRFAAAAGGTLFLDEIGELEPQLQAKLLRALEEREIQVLGESCRTVDVRIVVATNAELPQRITLRRFRADLYYRLARHEVEVPPLRDCREDIPALVEHFLREAARRSPKRVRGLSVGALEMLTAYDWPGNVRELENEAYRLFRRCAPGRAIDETMVSLHIRERRSPLGGDGGNGSADGGLRSQVRALERKLILEALRATDGNRSRAAERLRIHRNSLAAKIRSLGIAPHELPR